MSSFLQQEAIILASESLNRAQLLTSTGLSFDIVAANIDETELKKLNAHLSSQALAKVLAEAKALAVSARHPSDYVIGSDQICDIDGYRFDKPLTHERALAQLTQLQGTKHRQICAMAIAYQNEILWSIQDIAELTMKPMCQSVLEAYLNLDKPYYSCGSYHFESAGKWLFDDVKGSESSIQGLALVPLLKGLNQLGVVNLAG